MRSLAETLAHEPLNPVDQWRAIERLVALGWTEEAIGVALAQPVRQIKNLRLLANVLPAMLDQMAKGDMPDERQLRTIASASLEDQGGLEETQAEQGQTQVSWWSIAQALTKTRMYARDASFGEDLAQNGILWQEDLFAPADEDSRYTTDVEAYLGAQHEWMASHLPKRGAIVEVNEYGQPKLPPKADRVYGKPGKSDHTAMYLDRDGKVQSVCYRVPTQKQTGAVTSDGGAAEAKARPDVTRRGMEMIGDLRTDALHEALGRAPIEDDTLLALLVLAFAGQNVSTASGNADGYARIEQHGARLIDKGGKLAFDRETLQQVARAVLTCCRAARTAPIAASSHASQARRSVPIISCQTWVRRSSYPACPAPLSKRLAAARPCRRARG